MGCPCQDQSTPSTPVQNNQQQSGFAPVQNYVFDADCPFTLEMMQTWYGKLEGVKNSNTVDLYNLTYPKVNSYLGIIKSAINFSRNICFFRGELEQIQLVINVLP